MILDEMTDSARARALAAFMKSAGKVVRHVPLPQPTLLVGPGTSERLGELVAAFGHSRVLVVTDPVVSRLGLLRGLVAGLERQGVHHVVFDEMAPDAPIPLVEKGIACYREQGCDGIVAVGGGSSIDAAKGIALAIANPRPLRRLAGYVKGSRAAVPLYAVPTTAGTGSEATVAAVLHDPERQDKIVIVDPRLVPRAAALDATLMRALPPQVTAATGIDALTHAVEAFVGHWNSPYTDGMALAAVSLIFGHLRTCHADGNDIAARENMALASTYAGLAFTRANVGYVHAIAHQFGGRYHTPHGLANAIALPWVLRHAAPAIGARLARLAVAARLGAQGAPTPTLVLRFLEGVDALLRDVGIPRHLDALQAADIPEIAAASRAEARGYPVPRHLSQRECERLLRSMLPPPAPERVRPPRAAANPRSRRAAATTPAGRRPAVP